MLYFYLNMNNKVKSKRSKREKIFIDWFTRIMSGDIPISEEWVNDRLFFYFEDGYQVSFTREEVAAILPEIDIFCKEFNKLLDKEE